MMHRALFIVVCVHGPERPGCESRETVSSALSLRLLTINLKKMASDIVEEMEPESDVSVDIHELIPREGPVTFNLYGSLVADDETSEVDNEAGARGANNDLGETPVVSNTHVIAFVQVVSLSILRIEIPIEITGLQLQDNM